MIRTIEPVAVARLLRTMACAGPGAMVEFQSAPRRTGSRPARSAHASLPARDVNPALADIDVTQPQAEHLAAAQLASDHRRITPRPQRAPQRVDLRRREHPRQRPRRADQVRSLGGRAVRTRSIRGAAAGRRLRDAAVRAIFVAGRGSLASARPEPRRRASRLSARTAAGAAAPPRSARGPRPRGRTGARP